MGTFWKRKSPIPLFIRVSATLTWVQFLSTAPQKRKSHLRFPFLFYAFLDRNCGWEPFCESKTLCLTKLSYPPSRGQRTTLITSGAGRAAKGTIPVFIYMQVHARNTANVKPFLFRNYPVFRCSAQRADTC